jgi:hypothetical protein
LLDAMRADDQQALCNVTSVLPCRVHYGSFSSSVLPCDMLSM